MKFALNTLNVSLFARNNIHLFIASRHICSLLLESSNPHIPHKTEALSQYLLVLSGGARTDQHTQTFSKYLRYISPTRGQTTFNSCALAILPRIFDKEANMEYLHKIDIHFGKAHYSNYIVCYCLQGFRKYFNSFIKS